MEGASIVFRGTLVPRASRPNVVYRRGRRCVKEGCTTVLSVYNPGDACWRHADDIGSIRDRGAAA